MVKVIAAIEERLKELDGYIERLEKSVRSKGDETLVLSKIRDHTRFYVRKQDNEKRYLGKEESAAIARLAQKKYEEELLKTANREKKKLRKCLALLSDNDDSNLNTVLSSMAPELVKYIKPDESTDDGYARKWVEEKYYKAKRAEGHLFKTLNKDLVRSKSEVIIADRLYSAGIPYRYEQRLDLQDEHLNSIRYYPDFTILNKRTREIFYWEHLGNLGDPEYCFKNLTKLEYYSDNSILLGKNLILTFECQNKPLYTANVDRLIKEFLC